MTIDDETVLVRPRSVVLRLSDEDEVIIEVGSVGICAPRIAISLLDAFASPRAVGAVLESIAPSERKLEASSCIALLVKFGMLVSPERRGALGTRGWVKPSIHLEMLDDRGRTSGFCSALRSIVQPHDVVLDIGTGTGVLATCAALAGARHVYAVESSGIAEVAAQIFEANNVSDRVTLARERSTNVTLPEPASVLVTETIGNDPLDEQFLEIVADAKRRLLAPGARLIPSAIEIYGIAVDIPRAVLERHVFTKRKVDGYRAAYEIDFTPLESHRLPSSEPIMVEGCDVATWPLAPPILLAALDLTADFPTVLATRAVAQLSRTSQHLGVMLAFRAILAPGRILSTLPEDCDPTNHWAHALFPAFDCLAVDAGTTIAVDYGYERGKTTVRITPE